MNNTKIPQNAYNAKKRGKKTRNNTFGVIILYVIIQAPFLPVSFRENDNLHKRPLRGSNERWNLVR